MAGGYQNLIVYQQAVLIFDLNEEFCKRYLDSFKDKRTIEQMQQASRSGKQNIVEGSLEKSLKMHIKLTAVSRGSYGELLEDYKDFLRTRGLKIWAKDDERLAPLRAMRIKGDLSNESDRSNWSDIIGIDLTKWTNNPEHFANLMVTYFQRKTIFLIR